MRKNRSWILLFLALQGLNALAISAPSLSCTRSGESVRLSWGSVSGADHYVVVRARTPSPSAADIRESVGLATSYTDSSADSATTWYYWVEAWDSNNSSARSAMVTVSSGGGSGSGSGAFSISASDGTSAEGVVITWSAQAGATGYRVVRGNSSNMDYAGILVETVSGTSYTDMTAAPGTTYYYWIVAKKSAGFVTSSYDTGHRSSGNSTGTDSGVTWSYYVTSSGEAVVGTGSTDKRAVASSTTIDVTTPPTLGGCPVTAVSAYAFYTCGSLPGITVSSGVRSIGEEAFRECRSVTYISLPVTVTSIGRRAFMWCQQLGSLSIPPCVTNIGQEAFFGCSNMTSLKLPARFRGATGNLNIPSGCSVSYWGTPTLSVISDYGSPSPSGTGKVKTSGSSLTCTVGSPVTDASNSGIRYACTGWTGLGSVPASGSGASVTFTITDESLLTWNWKRQNRIAVTATGAGSCSYGTQWVDDGTTATATIVPSAHPYSITLSGDIEGVTVTGAKISIPSDRPRNISASVTSQNAEVIDISQGSTAGILMTDWNTYVIKNSVSFSNSAIGGNGMSVAEDATVVLYVPEGVTLTATGANGSGQTGGGAGIFVPESSTLIITGGGSVSATGGKAANGENGDDGLSGAMPYTMYIDGSCEAQGCSGAGGNGGAGGGGAGAGIGGFGGAGGAGGIGGKSLYSGNGFWPYASFPHNGLPGSSGAVGSSSAAMGQVYLIGTVSVVAASGSAGAAGVSGDTIGTVQCKGERSYYFASSGGGGGGGGGGGAAAESAIGSGGVAGGGGGGGGSGALLTKYGSTISNPARGGGGSGGASAQIAGAAGSAPTTSCNRTGGTGGAGGAGGAGGGAGTLYKAPTASVNVSRTTQSATTHVAAQYAVTFNAGEGNLPSGGQSATVTLGCAMPPITVPTRTGYTFGGYFTAANGGGTQYYTAAGASARSWDKTAATTLYAKWTANTYAVTFDRQGGSGGSSSATATYNAAMPSITVPTRTGYTFGGYYTSANGGGTQYYTAAGASARNWDRAETTRLYANWTANTYSVKFNKNTGSGSMSNESFTYDTAKALTPNAFTQTGYTFIGWATSASGAVVYTDGQLVSNLTATANGTVNLYAKWTANTYAVTFDRQSGSGGTSSATATYGSAMPSITLPTRTGYTFGGYYTATNGGGTQYYTSAGASARSWDKTAATTLYAKWTANTYAVTLNHQSGSGGTSSVTATYGSAMPSITIPTREHYAFGGYYTAANGGGTRYYTAAGASARNWDKTAATTLYAKWEQTQYQISVTATGAGSCSFGTQWVDAGTTTTATIVPSSGSFRAKLLGDIDGVTVEGTTISIPATRTRNITVSVTADSEIHTYHVDAANGSDSNDGLSWATAKKTIQSAIDLAYGGDTVLVADGTYAPITAQCLGIEIRSVNGAEATIIDGGDATRCTTLGYATNDTVKTTLVGFTLRNGTADIGGGALGGILEQCVIEGNVSTKASGNYCGGGAVHGDLRRCIVRNNTSNDDGGGVSGCRLYDCLVYGNHSNNNGGIGGGGAGGGIDHSFAVRCTIVGNTANRDISDTGPGGAGVCASVLESCIIWGNSYTDGTADDLFSSTATYSCFGSAVPGTGNITADPLFVDAANGDYRLQSGSPCIEKGIGSGVPWQSVDLDGNPRRVGNTTDMGCYEFSTHREPTTIHVDVATGDDANDGLSSSAPKKSIQSALEWSIDGDTILVNDGVYTRSNGMVVNNEVHNRVITIQSVNGPERTIIDGGGANRCAKLSANLNGRTAANVATLSGFTVTNGLNSACGGVTHGVVENCMITGCVGTHGSTSGSAYTGGASSCKLINCLIRGNSVIAGSDIPESGGAGSCNLYNCTVVENTAVAGASVAGLSRCKAYNCIVVGNTVDGAAADVASNCTVANSCLGTSFSGMGTGNIVADPLFVDAANGDYRLSVGSPCIGTGDNAKAAGETDLAGGLRIMDLLVDMGCYEFQGMSVTLDRQSGTGGSASVTATYGSAMPSITVPTRTGYAFGGYYTAANGGGTQYYTAAGASARSWDKTAATTLYAKWTANTYAVTLDRQSGTGGSSSVTATYGSAMPSITVPTREHYAFDGYYTAANGGGTQYYTAAGASARNWDKTEETTLYAKWEQTQYQISVTATGSGSCSFGTQWVDVGTTATATVVPSSSSYRIKLLGDINDVTLDGITLSIPATQKRNITVSVTDDTEPRTYHVDAANGNNSNDGLSWNTAKKTIQSAIDLAYGGDTILVADGTYSPITARCLGIEIRSVNGAASTIIDGGGVNRCASIGYGTNDIIKTKLVGFTLRNGRNVLGTGAQGGILVECIVTGNFAGNESDDSLLKDGGGLFGSIAHYCVISNNQASSRGGGLFRSVAYCCNIVSNVASDDGGGAHSCQLLDCLVSNNRANNRGGSISGGGIYSSQAKRCTIVDNQSGYGSSSKPGGAGADNSVLESCIVYGNTYTTGVAGDVFMSTATYSCLGSAVSGTGNIVADPLFVDPANGNYRLQAGSPCIDAGELTTEAKIGTDLDGHPRWIGVGSDMGCYEWATHYTAATQYVAQATGDDANDGLSWETAKATIQNAIDWAVDGDEIVVGDGVYTEDDTIVNRKNAHLLIQSVNGATSTAIDGEGRHRCIAMTAREPMAPSTSYIHEKWRDYVTMDGFTFRNGYSPFGGGGVRSVTLKNCILTGCVSGSGGAAYAANMENCLIVGNANLNGSNAEASPCAVAIGSLVNCTVVANTNLSSVGACVLRNCTVTNCVVAGNIVVDAPVAYEVDASCKVGYSCLDTATSGTGNIVADPLFVDAANGDYRLSADSPCVGAGDNAKAAGETDLAGDTRVRGLHVDMGCYEWQGTPATPVITPADGTILSGSLSVSISCATDGAVIHYTTDGSEPTAESPVYRRFRVTQRTIVKAVAVRDGLYSEVAVAEYAAGQCADPVITAQASFTGSKTSVTLSCATPDARIYYTTNGDAPNTNSTWYTGPFDVTDSCTVKAYATCANYRDSAVVTFAITKVWAIGDTMDAPDQPFTTGGNLPFFRVDDATAPLGESMKSGAITHRQMSTLTTTVVGPGTVSFQWKTSCEDSGGEYDWDHAEFRVDGAPVAYLDGVTAWQTVTHVVSGTGQHTLEWRYVKDDVETDGQDCCWVADFRWSPAAITATQTTPEPVPYSWLRGFYPGIPDEYAAYESAAFATAKNGRPVWECYVADLDPEDPDDDLLANIEIVNGEPRISILKGESANRVYETQGAASPSGPWGKVTGDSRFFRIKVSLP